MQKYWLPWLVGMPTETAIAGCALMFGGVLERLPGLRVCLAHGGGSLPATIGRIDHGFHVRPDLCAVDTAVAPRDGLGRLWVDSLVHDPGMLRYLVHTMGARRICLGSDYPFPLGEPVPGRLIETTPGLDPADRRAMLADNAFAFLGVDRGRFA
jgi:aminocarboxymuconate-semialdehyde decarboxylase